MAEEKQSQVSQSAIDELQAAYAKLTGSPIPHKPSPIVAPQQLTPAPKVEVPQVEKVPATVAKKPLESPHISVPSSQEVAMPSFDKVLERVLQQKFRDVDEKAVAEKARIMSDLGKTMDDFGDRLLSLMEPPQPQQRPVQTMRPASIVETEKPPLPSNPKIKTKQSHWKLYTLLALGFTVTFLASIAIGLGLL